MDTATTTAAADAGAQAETVGDDCFPTGAAGADVWVDDPAAHDEPGPDTPPAMELVIDRPDVVVTARWYDSWTVATSDDMGKWAELLRAVAAPYPDPCTPLYLGEIQTSSPVPAFVSRLRGALAKEFAEDTPALRELRDAGLRWKVTARDQSRCRLCGAHVAFGTDRSEFPNLPAGVLSQVIPGVASGADNVIVSCQSCDEQRNGRTPAEAGMQLLPCPTQQQRDDVDIHTAFGLSYSNYWVLPRTLLQSMPLPWQHQFTALLGQLSEAFAHVEQAQAYHVEAGTWHAPSDLSVVDLAAARITRTWTTPGGDVVSDADYEAADDDRYADADAVYRDADGNELDAHASCAFLPGPDPVPHYNRGRTRIEPVLS